MTFEHKVGAQVAMVDEAQYRDSMVALSVLEGAATALAACRLTVADLQQARAINARMIATLDHFDPLLFTTLNQEFHSVLFTKCVNARMVTLVQAEWARLGHLRSSTFSFVPGRAHESVSEHDTIVDLIETGAPLEEIEDAARRHRTATLDAYLAYEHPDRAAFGLPA